jgi:predicted nicotinamide N-methyase
VQHQNVLELAAGLGLPTFVAARYAQSVCCSDYLEEAVATMARTAQHLQLSNVTSQVLDWNHLPDDLTADVLLLCDVNYDPDQFARLYHVLQRFLRQGTLILLSTPQRLMAKPFIEKLLPFCRQQYEMSIYHLQEHTPISLLLLKEQEIH